MVLLQVVLITLHEGLGCFAEEIRFCLVWFLLTENLTEGAHLVVPRQCEIADENVCGRVSIAGVCWSV